MKKNFRQEMIKEITAAFLVKEHTKKPSGQIIQDLADKIISLSPLTGKEQIAEVINYIYDLPDFDYDPGAVLNNIRQKLQKIMESSSTVDVPDTNVGEIQRDWISVEDGLPDVNAWVLCAGRYGQVFLHAMQFDGDGFVPYGNPYKDERVEYWMPLPNPPKQ